MIMDEACDSDFELDDKWIVQFENKDKLYQDYYLDHVHYVCVYYIYVNASNCIEQIKEEMFIMSKLGCILRNELIDLIKRNCKIQNIKYSLLSLLKFNITMEPLEVKQCHHDHDFDLIDFGNKYFSVLRQIDNVYFENTIHMFQDLNSLVVVFYNDNTTEIQSQCHNQGQKQYQSQSQDKNSGMKQNQLQSKPLQRHTTTKKIRFDTIMKIHNKNKKLKKSKTIRKQYKE